MLADCHFAPSPPREPRQQKNLRPLRQLLPPSIPINHPVDRHRDPAIDPRLEPGILFSQFPEQFPDVLGFNLDLALAAGELAERAPKGDFDQI